MAERPILFSASMVQAILAGRKTQTRRALRVQPPAATEAVATFHHPDPRPMFYANDGGSLLDWCAPCPFGQPGDRLWVKETFRLTKEFDASPPSAGSAANRIWYEADKPHQPGFGKTRVSIHMPRWASRITLEITNVRVERLQLISEADAMSEGASQHPDGLWHAFRSLWTLINGAGSWDANPFVWVVEFKRLEA